MSRVYISPFELKLPLVRILNIIASAVIYKNAKSLLDWDESEIEHKCLHFCDLELTGNCKLKIHLHKCYQSNTEQVVEEILRTRFAISPIFLDVVYCGCIKKRAGIYTLEFTISDLDEVETVAQDIISIKIEIIKQVKYD